MKLINLILFLLILSSFILTGWLVKEYNSFVISENQILEKANLTRVIDGDTIETSIGKVRLLGINTPEKNNFGYEEAKNYLVQFLGKEIELEQTNEDRDKYGRMLRYIFYNNINLNLELIESGWAHYYSYTEDKYSGILKKAEENARNSGLGIWKLSNLSCARCIKLVKLNEIDPGEYIILGNRCNFDCNLKDWKIDDDSSSHTKKLDFVLSGNSEKQIDYSGSIWNDAGDSLYLRDNSGFLVIFYRY